MFSHDSSLIAFADKFGDIMTARVLPEDQQAEPVAAPLLGHLCSIVTSLAFSPDGKHLVSTDQDCKVRVSTMPKQPQKVVLQIAYNPTTRLADVLVSMLACLMVHLQASVAFSTSRLVFSKFGCTVMSFSCVR